MEVLGVVSGAASAVAATIVLVREAIRAGRKMRDRRKPMAAGVFVAGVAVLMWAARGK